MRFHSHYLLALLPAAGLLSGCAMGPQGASTNVTPQATSKTVTGKTFGGQQAVAKAAIAVYQYGTSGYGSTGTQLATTTTDSGGNFTLSYTCTDPNAPVYILSLGGQPGPNITNAVIAEGSAIGTCSASESAYVTISEISTVALAFSLSHFFSATNADGTTSDHFGAPASLSNAISLVNSHLIPTILDVENGYPRQSTATFTNESSKIITLADILGSCVNSDGAGSPSCSSLFSYATTPGGAVPTDTLQAAVNIALNPGLNVAGLYSLVPPSGSSPFAGSLTRQPNDWTLAVNYITPTLGLGADTHTVTTLDIDTNGRVWFPSNLPGAAGVGYFDPGTSAFSAPLVAAGLVRPEQVAIDVNGYVWATDLESSNVAGYSTSNPTAAPTVLSIAGTTSTALTVLDDNTFRVAIVNSANEPALAEINTAAETTGGASYTAIPNSAPAGSQGYIGASVAGDTVGGLGISGTDTQQGNMFDIYADPTSAESSVFFYSGADSGQIAFNGDDFIVARGGFYNSTDGICSFVERNCYAMANQDFLRHPSGLAVDGSGNLWLADIFGSEVQEIPRTNGNLLNANGQAPNQVYPHGSADGATIVQAGGIGVDATGNVWVSNVSCYAVGCTPGPFVLSELLGAGVPTINPVAAQVVLNTTPGVEPSARRTGTKSK
ncbi:MAG: hypothetical protein ACRYFU_12605 [Janthinobacterium lividum]